ncbi:MAG: SulP family inorganic anion transporter [Phormidesmis sp.]
MNRLQIDNLLPNVTAGLAAGVICVSFELSFAALIFSGRLAEHLSFGVGLILFSVATTSVLIILLSSCPQIVVGSATAETAILAWTAGAIAKDLSPAVPSAEILTTVIAMIALTSVLTGMVLLVLGLFRAGNLVRWLPHPIVGSFMASSGWLLVTGAFEVMADHPLKVAQMPLLIQPEALIRWIPGLLFALYLLLLSRQKAHPFVIPLSLFAGIALFYLLLSFTDIPIAEASAQGWMLEVQQTQGLWQPLSWSNLPQVHWSAIAHQYVCIATVVFLTAISLPLKMSGLELVMKQTIDSNQELKAAGVANLAVGCVGGSLSYHAMNDTLLVHTLGATSRLANWIGVSVFIAISVLGSSLLAYFPKPILGGLLLFLGLLMLLEWSYDSWFTLSKQDYFIVQLILVTSILIGFLQGLVIGWGMTVVLSTLRLYQKKFHHS